MNDSFTLRINMYVLLHGLQSILKINLSQRKHTFEQKKHKLHLPLKCMSLSSLYKK